MIVFGKVVNFNTTEFGVHFVYSKTLLLRPTLGLGKSGLYNEGGLNSGV